MNLRTKVGKQDAEARSLQSHVFCFFPPPFFLPLLRFSPPPLSFPIDQYSLPPGRSNYSFSLPSTFGNGRKKNLLLTNTIFLTLLSLRLPATFSFLGKIPGLAYSSTSFMGAWRHFGCICSSKRNRVEEWRGGGREKKKFRLLLPPLSIREKGGAHSKLSHLH